VARRREMDERWRKGGGEAVEWKEENGVCMNGESRERGGGRAAPQRRGQ
jgi:hypothetical protein